MCGSCQNCGYTNECGETICQACGHVLVNYKVK